MNFDDLDVRIIKEMLFLNGSPVTTSSLAKKLFITETRRDLQKADNIIRSRLAKMDKYGLMKTTIEGNKKTYTLNGDSLFLGFKRGNQLVWMKLQQ